MVNSDNVTNLLLSNLLNNIKSLEKILEEFLIENYPFPEIKNLIHNLLILLTNFYSEIDLLEEQLSNVGPSEDLNESIILYTGLVEYTHTLFGLIRMAQEHNISKSIIYLIRYLTEPLKEKSNFIVIPSYTYNYFYSELNSQIKDKFINIIDGTEEIFKDGDKKFSILIYPYIYNKNIVMNTLLAHELGHFIEIENNVINRLITSISIEPQEIERIIRSRLDGGTTRTLEEYMKIETLKAKIHKETQDLINYWLQELFCDLIGYYLVGPMYLIINTEFLLSVGKSTVIYKEHPSIEMRLKNLFNIYFNGDFIQDYDASNIYLKNFNDYLLEIKEYVDSIHVNLPNNSVQKLAYEKTKSITDLLNEIVRDNLEVYENIYKKEDYLKEVNILVNTITNLIVPCETRQGIPANIISILNASIIFDILKIDETYENYKDHFGDITYIEFKYKINQLISRAVELSTMHHKLMEENYNE
jgi:aspartate/glutamate racemase